MPAPKKPAKKAVAKAMPFAPKVKKVVSDNDADDMPKGKMMPKAKGSMPPWLKTKGGK